MDQITITGLRVFAHHGVYPEETKNGQDFYVNIRLNTDIGQAGKQDCLDLSTDYGAVCHFVSDFMQKHTFQLIEAVAEQTAKALLLHFPLIYRVQLEICKPDAPIGLPFENVSVTVTRGWERVYLGIGSNMGDKRRYIEEAIQLLREEPAIRRIRVSSLLETTPYGMTEQDVFLNGVIELETLFTPFELLDFMHEVESAAGRTREIHWGPRTLDLDLIFYGEDKIYTETLTVPHPDMHNRGFVLEPLLELNPHLVHPVFNVCISQILKSLYLNKPVS